MRLSKISRYSKSAEETSIRVRHFCQLSSSVCSRPQNDSITALSSPSPTDPMEGSKPAWRTRSLKLQQVNRVPWSEWITVPVVGVRSVSAIGSALVTSEEA